MKKEIKERIEQIKNGIVPEGYKKTKLGIIPKDWEVQRLGNLFNLISGLPISRARLTKDGIPYLHYGDIHRRYKTYLNLEEEINIISKYKVSIESVKKDVFLKMGDIVFVDASEDYEGVGKSVVIYNNNDYPLISGLHTIIARPKNKDIINEFKRYFLLNWSIRKQLIFYATGISVLGISKTNIRKIRFYLPSKKEQQRIANILSTWDKAIELKEKLIEQKKKQKKGLMQLLLTGKKRLKGFDVGWKKLNFDDCFIKFSSKKYQIKTNEYDDKGEIPVIDQGKEKIVSFSNLKEKTFKCPNNGVIIFGDHTRIIKYIDFDFIIGADGTQILGPKKLFNIKFLYYQLQIKKIPNMGYNRHFKFLKRLKFVQPSIDEQNAIVNILSTIDSEISLLEKQLEELKRQKKGLMQLLLTGIVRVN